MTDENTKSYFDIFQTELSKLEKGKFSGNSEFKVSLKEGVVYNCNVELNKNVKISRKDKFLTVKETIEEYLRIIQREINELAETGFYGILNVEINLFGGNIANINFSRKKSYKI